MKTILIFILFAPWFGAAGQLAGDTNAVYLETLRQEIAGIEENKKFLDTVFQLSTTRCLVRAAEIADREGLAQQYVVGDSSLRNQASSRMLAIIDSIMRDGRLVQYFEQTQMDKARWNFRRLALEDLIKKKQDELAIGPK